MNKISTLKNSLKNFEQLIETAPDNKESVAIFINFLRGFLRARDPKFSLPSAEVMTILKKEKPTVFYFLKKQASQNPSLDLLTQIEINYDQAIQRLNELKAKL